MMTFVYLLKSDDGMHKDLPCAVPITGRYVYIQMVGIEGSLSLCEVFVFTTKGMTNFVVIIIIFEIIFKDNAMKSKAIISDIEFYILML